MNYQYLLQQVYGQDELKDKDSVIIKNPFDMDSSQEIKTNSSYDLSVLNTSIPAQEIVEMVQNAIANDRRNNNAQGIRILFYGVSGGGKTNLAHFIAESIGKEIISKNASDILGMYVGESEKRIADAFATAKKQNKVLLFDEVDSFFRDRSLASQSWEITQVNEFLTQMEKFEGITICTTNLREIMDPAMQRRFHIMVEFKALEEEGVKKLCSKYFPEMKFSETDIEKVSGFQSATPGDFGNLSSRLRFMSQDKITESYIIDELCKMQEEKQFGKKTVGFLN